MTKPKAWKPGYTVFTHRGQSISIDTGRDSAPVMVYCEDGWEPTAFQSADFAIGMRIDGRRAAKQVFAWTVSQAG